MHLMGWGVKLIHYLAVRWETITSMSGHRWCWADMLAAIPAPVCWRRRRRATRAWRGPKLVWLREFVGHLSRIVLSMRVDMGILVSVIVRPVTLGVIASVHRIVHLVSFIRNGLGNRCNSKGITTVSVHIWTISIALGPREMLWWCAVLDILQWRLVGNVAWSRMSPRWRLDVLRKCCLWRLIASRWCLNVVGNCSWRCCSGDWIRRQRSSLDGSLWLSRPLKTVSGSIFHTIRSTLLHLIWFLLLWTRIVVGDFDPDLPRIFALASQRMPNIILPPTWNDNLLQIDPSLPNNLSLLVIVENRNLQLVVVGRVVDGKSELLVPMKRVSKSTFSAADPPAFSPSWCLPSSTICLCFLCFLAKPRRAIRVLLANCLPVWQILRTINNNNQSSDLRSIHSHVRIDPRRVHCIEAVGLHFRRHGGRDIMRSCRNGEASRVEEGFVYEALKTLYGIVRNSKEGFREVPARRLHEDAL
jgi:hypothetical protein